MRKLLSFVMMLIATTVFSADRYVGRDLLYFWDFESKNNWTIDKKLGAEAFTSGKIRWVPPHVSFQDPESGVIHLHGDKNTTTFFLIPAKYTADKDFSEWTVDFEFAMGSHPLDNEDHGDLNVGKIFDGVVLEWGDLTVFYMEAGDPWRGTVIVEYRQRAMQIHNVPAFDYNHLVLRSEKRGVSIWVNTQCVQYINTPTTSMKSKPIKFASDGYAGRLDDIKIYNTRLKPWEITFNYWGTELRVDPSKDQLITTWGRIKRQRIK